jgi:predicted permease
MRWEHWFFTIPLRLRSLFRRTRVEQELDEELQFHFDRRMEQELAAGRSTDEARQIALRAMEGLTQRKEECRDMRRVNYFEHLMQDLRYAGRMFRRSPGFAMVAVITLALGIGVNTAIFSTVDSAMLRALPYADPDRLVMVWEDLSYAGFEKNTPAPGNFTEWKRRNRVFTDMAASRGRAANLTADGPPEQVFGRGVTPNFFSVLGVRPIVGRTFTEEEDRTRAPVVVISYGLWQRRYNGDASLAGKQILMDGSKFTVIGVMPREFAFRQKDADYFAPAGFSAAELQNRRSHYLNVVARLKPGVTLERAREEMSAIAAELARLYPENRRTGATVVPVREELLGKVRTGLLVLMSAAGCVLLIACANLASLLLARTVARQREISVRVALGAGRGRLVRQMITEGVTLAAAGGVLGVAMAPAGIRVLARLVPDTLPPSAAPHLNARMLAFAVLLSMATGLLFSLIPAFQTARRSLSDALKQDGRAGMSARGHAVRDALVVVEVAMALVLLVGAGLMLQTLAALRAIDIGFRPDHLLVARTFLPSPKYKAPRDRMAFVDRVLEGVSALPGVESAAYASTLPFLSRGNTSGYRIEGRRLDADDPGDALDRVVTSDYLATLGVHLIEGRLFERGDGPGRAPVVVVNESFARRYWPKESALGHRITIYDDSTWRTIVGVVRDIRERGYELDLKPGVYRPLDLADGYSVSQLVVRAAGDPLSVAPAVRRVIAAVDPEQPVSAVRTMDDVIELQVTDRRQELTLLATFAALALILACIGLYGVLSYAVTQRSREIGVRMALGASGGKVLRMVVGRGLLLTAIGLLLGAGASWGLTGLMRGMLYGVRPTDPATFAGVAALLGAVSAIACWIPARRASRLDPMVVLRED